MNFIKKKWWLVPALITVMTYLIFKYIIIVGYVPTASMEPAISRNSIVIGSRIYKELNVGDIIIFEHDGKMLVKRIAGVEGDMVEWRGQMVSVPKDSYYVLGDNVTVSVDSRYWDEPFVEKGIIYIFLMGWKQSFFKSLAHFFTFITSFST